MQVRRRPRRSPSRTIAVAVALVAVVVALGVAVPAVVTAAAGSPARALTGPRHRFVPVPESPGSTTRIRIDTDLYLPATRPAPAVLLAHGFGQDEGDLASDARRLQREGYVVLAYSARGFGRSGGRIGLDALDGEVADARALVDVLDARRDVLHRGGDPVVGVVGASYGGALALMLGATDPRIDTVVAGITWNDLGQALLPYSRGWVRGQEQERLFKTGWASRLFGAGAAGDADPCNRFTPQLCSLYRRLVTGGAPTADDLALLRDSSPDAVLDRMTAPVLLLQGLEDSLFTLGQADLTARQIRRAGASVQVHWFDGGHDGGGISGTEDTVDRWLDARLRQHRQPSQRFEYDVPASATSFPEHHVQARYPGLWGRSAAEVTLKGGAQSVVNPPGGQPTSITSLPGIAAGSDVGRAAGGLLAGRNPPDQAARFTSAPFRKPVVLGGAASVRLRVTPLSGDGGDAVLFGQLSAVTGSGSRALPGGVAPVRFRVPAGGTTVVVVLPSTVWRFAQGDRLALTLRTTDAQFLGSTAPASYRIASVGAIRLPELPAPSAATVSAPSTDQLRRAGALVAAALLLVLAAAVVGRVRSRSARRTEADAARTGSMPALVVRGLTKRFRSGFLAVDDVSFTVPTGRVVGLLGENGAGKTTTMRMVLGLTRPDAGEVEVFGVRVEPGTPVLDRVGAFVEGPGFLPHLSGLRNLRLYWAATGRPRRESRLAEVLEIADLGDDVRRPVRGYSQGMRQRLAIAQAMLGMPDLLVLDEPTNGLDPPQITALRGVLQRYAADGRTVVVSSHLLGEVERTCSHVVVMSHGRLVAAGPVAEVAGESQEILLEVDDPVAAVAAAESVGVVSARRTGTGSVRVLTGAVPTGVVVAAVVRAGVQLTDLQRGRHLEEAFLELIGATGRRGDVEEAAP